MPRFSPLWLPVKETAGELRDECTTLDSLLQEIFADVDALRGELDAKADELEESRRRMAERGRQLAEQRKESSQLTHKLDEQETRLNETLAELRALREQFAREQELARQQQAEQHAVLQQHVAQMEAERAELLAELQTLRAQIPQGEQSPGISLTPLLDEVSALREEVQETRSELSGAIDRVAERGSSPAAPAEMGSEVAEQLRSLEREKCELENELDLVRTRAAELHETVAAQKQELAGQRNELAEDIGQLRRLIEQQAELLAQREADDNPVRSEPAVTMRKSLPLKPAATPPSVENEPAAAADPVVNSVMAQFAKLQKDVAQRRKKK